MVVRCRRGRVARSVAYLAWCYGPITFVGQVRMQQGVWYGPVVIGPVPAECPHAYEEPFVADALQVRALLKYRDDCMRHWGPLID